MSIHFRTATASIRRSPFQAISAIFVLTLTFFVSTLFLVLVYSSNAILNYFETRPQVIAFVKSDVEDADIASLQHKLEADSRIKEVRYVNKDEALTLYKKATSDKPQLGELVSPSIFPASLEFSVTELSFAQEVIEEVKNEKIIDSVGFTAAIGDDSNLNDVVSKLKNITTYIKYGGIIFTGVLAFASLVVLLVIISMRLASRKEEIEILKLIGATQKFIRGPIVIEAMIYVLVGVILGWVLSLILTLYLSPSLVSFFREIPVLPRHFVDVLKLFGVILAGELLIGILIAYFGSFLAVRRARKFR